MFNRNKPRVTGHRTSTGWTYGFRCPAGLCDTHWYRWRLAYTSARWCYWLGHYEFDLPHLRTEPAPERLTAGADVYGNYPFRLL